MLGYSITSATSFDAASKLRTNIIRIKDNITDVSIRQGKEEGRKSKLPKGNLRKRICTRTEVAKGTGWNLIPVKRNLGKRERKKHREGKSERGGER